MFRWVKSTLRKSEAAVVVQDALVSAMINAQHVKEPALLANRLVAKVWDHSPDVFNGKKGGYPHKLAIAAIALAQGLDDCRDGDAAEHTIKMALGSVILLIHNDIGNYQFAMVDLRFIDLARDKYLSH